MLQSFDDFIARIGNGYRGSVYGYVDLQAGTINPTGASPSFQLDGIFDPLPSLPSGVTAFIPTFFAHYQSGTRDGSILLAKVIDLGKLTLDATTAGVFTDGSAMPSVTEGGVSRQVPGILALEFTTALSATPGTFSYTYTDQDGNTGNVISGNGLNANGTVGSVGFPILTSPDTGVVDITAAARTGTTTAGGVIQFWGLIPIAQGMMSSEGIVLANMLINQFNPIRLGAGDLLRAFMIIDSTAAHAAINMVHLVGDN